MINPIQRYKKLKSSDILTTESSVIVFRLADAFAKSRAYYDLAVCFIIKLINRVFHTSLLQVKC